jgi:hypothetical protein
MTQRVKRYTPAFTGQASGIDDGPSPQRRKRMDEVQAKIRKREKRRKAKRMTPGERRAMS